MISESMSWPIPNIREKFDRLGQKHAKFFAKIDLTSGYHQIPVDEACRHLLVDRNRARRSRWEFNDLVIVRCWTYPFGVSSLEDPLGAYPIR